MNRVLRVAQVQLTTWRQTFGWPVAILGISFAFNLAFYMSMGDAIHGQQITGGVVSIFIFQAILCANLMTQGFSFAVGLNVTRRTFFAASSVVIGIQSLAFSVLLYLLSIVEQLTDLWGGSMIYFTLLPITRTYSPITIVVFLVPMLVASFFGLLFGVVGKRWGTNGVLGVSVLTLVALGSGTVLITWLDGWGAVRDWLDGQPGLALAAGWTLLPLAAFVAGTFALTRRAIP
jgi:hypothetical protein